VFAQIVLILAHADRSGINLDQLSERVLKPPEKGAAMPDLGDPAWRGMVCVETGNVADDEVRLSACNEHQMSTLVAVDTLQ